MIMLGWFTEPWSEWSEQSWFVALLFTIVNAWMEYLFLTYDGLNFIFSFELVSKLVSKHMGCICYALLRCYFTHTCMYNGYNSKQVFFYAIMDTRELLKLLSVGYHNRIDPLCWHFKNFRLVQYRFYWWRNFWNHWLDRFGYLLRPSL